MSRNEAMKMTIFTGKKKTFFGCYQEAINIYVKSKDDKMEGRNRRNSKWKMALEFIFIYTFFFFKHSYFHGLVRLKQFWGKKSELWKPFKKKKVYPFFSTKKSKKRRKRNEKYLSGVKVHQMLQVEFNEQGKSRNKFNVFCDMICFLFFF